MANKRVAPRRRPITKSIGTKVEERNTKIEEVRTKVEEQNPKIAEEEAGQSSKAYDQREAAVSEGLGSVKKEEARSGLRRGTASPEKKKEEAGKLTWKKIPINPEQILNETEKSTLIDLPENELYPGYAFWHPKRLVRKQGDQAMLSFSDDFVFKLVKSEKSGEDDFTVVDTVKVGPKILEKVFERETRAYWSRS